MTRLLVAAFLISLLVRVVVGKWPWEYLSAKPTRAQAVFRARKLLGVTAAEIANAAAAPIHDEEATHAEPATAEPEPHTPTCPCCGSKMRIIEVFHRGQAPRHKASPRPPSIRIDTS